jgi:hypothetical protein
LEIRTVEQECEHVALAVLKVLAVSLMVVESAGLV